MRLYLSLVRAWSDEKLETFCRMFNLPIVKERKDNITTILEYTRDHLLIEQIPGSSSSEEKYNVVGKDSLLYFLRGLEKGKYIEYSQKKEYLLSNVLPKIIGVANPEIIFDCSNYLEGKLNVDDLHRLMIASYKSKLVYNATKCNKELDYTFSRAMTLFQKNMRLALNTFNAYEMPEYLDQIISAVKTMYQKNDRSSSILIGGHRYSEKIYFLWYRILEYAKGHLLYRLLEIYNIYPNVYLLVYAVLLLVLPIKGKIKKQVYKPHVNSHLSKKDLNPYFVDKVRYTYNYTDILENYYALRIFGSSRR